MKTLESRQCVVITGAGSGIGNACAILLGKAGWNVFAGVRTQVDVDRIQQDPPQNVTPIQMDIISQASLQRAAQIITEKLEGRKLWALVNNAGIAIAGPLEFFPLEKLRHQLEVNLVGQIAVVQTFLPLIRTARGRIINISSVAGVVSSPFSGPYVASKHALEGITDVLRLELRPWGIRVSLVEPGEIATPIWTKTSDGIKNMISEFPPAARQMYAPGLEILGKLKVHGTSPDVVARAVMHAIESRKPRIRYFIGKDAKPAAFLRHLPSSIIDRIILGRLPE
jgi:NAD(P)-dependent dehydrogenase (short-subunit alcohol dehydrogenase family)